jgi:hypothetical protein
VANKKKASNKTQTILYAVIILLVCVSLVLGIKLHNKSRYQAALTPAINVSLGPLSYTIINGKPVDNSSPNVLTLKSYLTATAQKDIELGCKTTYYHVIAASQNEEQVLLNYGCDYPNAQMFATYNSGGWKLISPTSEFDRFGIPSCDYVNQYNISTSIAPVCVNGLLQNSFSLQYQVR